MEPGNDDEKTKNNIVYAFGKKPPPDQERQGEAQIVPAEEDKDNDAIKYLEDILERFKKGELVGFAMVVGVADENMEPFDIETWVSNRAFDSDLQFLGATSILQDHLKSTRLPSALEYSLE